MKDLQAAYSYISQIEGELYSDWDVACEGILEDEKGIKYYYIQIFDWWDRKTYFFKISP